MKIKKKLSEEKSPQRRKKTWSNLKIDKSRK